MANDTTRMEQKTPVRHLAREGEREYAVIRRNRSGQDSGGIDYSIDVSAVDGLSPAEKEDLFRTAVAMTNALGRYCGEANNPDGAHYAKNLAAMAADVTSLQRELAEARNALGTEQEMHNAWRKRGEEAESDVETCRSLAKRLYAWVERSPEMTSEYDEVRQVKDDARKILFAPAPSDVKGDDNGVDWTFDNANACIKGMAVALGVDDPNAMPLGLGLRILAAIAALKSRASLTPLTDPSVRGVLVDDGEPRKLEPGEIGWSIMELYSHPHHGGTSLFKYQPVALRPASDFGVAGGERIKELEAELAKRTQERDEAVPFMVALKGRHNGYDPGNSKMFPAGPPATPEVALNELIEEQEWLVNSELQQAQSDAERLRKAIETHRLEWGAGRVIESNNRLWSALSPSPAAASGRDVAMDVLRRAEAERDQSREPTSAPAAESDKPYGLVEQMDAGEGTVYGRRMTVEMRKEPAAGTQGNSQHHSEGAKILDGGSGIAAAESEGGEPPRIAELYLGNVDREPTVNRQRAIERERWLESRLAACEERCRELESGIENHRRQHQAIYEELDGAEKFDKELWSLLAPKAGGEDGK